MWQRLFHHKLALAVITTITFMFAFAPFDFGPSAFIGAATFSLFVMRCDSFRAGFRNGFIMCVLMMIAGFSWVTYVLHEFGYLPWPIAFLIFVGFCGIGALNVPLFVGGAAYLQSIFKKSKLPVWWYSLWWTLGFPAFFVLCEYSVPKLFPWYFGHGLYKLTLLTQISEITGSIFLSFALFSLGAAVAARIAFEDERRCQRWAFAIPGAIWAITIGFGVYRLSHPTLETHRLNVALIQANIGSLEKVAAERGIWGKINSTIDRYENLTHLALASQPKPQILLWPETALPFPMDSPGVFQNEITSVVRRWGVPLITGAYARSPYHSNREYNAAFLLEPPQEPTRPLRVDMYPKNVLLAFGEYMPLGDSFPILYRWFPQVSNFELGNVQKVFSLSDGTRLAMTICYEDIIPTFVRKVAEQRANALVNLTNDSWFGPTAEPRQHAQLATFRSIETRLPMIRVTNTGISFSVDDRGRMSETTGVYQEGVLNLPVIIPNNPPLTFYVQFGDWFIGLCTAILVVLLMVARQKKYVPIPV